jgi:UBX domain-containing protein 1
MVTTLSDLKGKKDAKKKTVDFYTGGSKSGLQVETPAEDLVKSIASKAKDPKPPIDGKPKSRTDVKITLYKNGFIIDDEPFRGLDRPENVEFLKELKGGHVPKELADKFKKSIDVGLIDRSEENYEKPKPLYEKIGKPNEDVSKFIGIKQIDSDAQKFAKVDKAKSLTILTFRLPDGSSKTMEFNVDQTLNEVHAIICKAFNLMPSKTRLLTGFPPKEITAMANTIDQNKLAKSTLHVKVI